MSSAFEGGQSMRPLGAASFSLPLPAASGSSSSSAFAPLSSLLQSAMSAPAPSMTYSSSSALCSMNSAEARKMEAQRKVESDMGFSSIVSSFSPAVESVLNEIQQGDSGDVFDSPHFNAIEYINQHFPNESSLGNLDTFSSKLKSRVRQVDDELLTTVRRQSATARVGQDLKEAKQAIQELFTKVREIKSKAEQSESMVQEICRDIKSLDYAKRHLTTTITALKRLQMLVSAVEQLKVLSSRRQYAESASYLEAVNQLASDFDRYKDVEKIRELRDSIARLREMLTSQVIDEFRGMDVQRDDGEVSRETIRDACAVVDALGEDVRRDIVAKYCTQKISQYRMLFTRQHEDYVLEKIERRFTWFRKAMKGFEENWNGFVPAKWNMTQEMCVEFCLATREVVEVLLRETGAATSDVPADMHDALRNHLKSHPLWNRTQQYIANELKVSQSTVSKYLSGLVDSPSIMDNFLRLRPDEARRIGLSPVVAMTGAATSDVNILLKVLQRTLDFEKDMEKKFVDKQSNMAHLSTVSLDMDDAADDKEMEALDLASAEGIKKKWEIIKRKQERSRLRQERKYSAEMENDIFREPEARSHYRFAGLISSCFEPYLGVYVQSEEKSMGELVARLVKEETWQPEDEHRRVLRSSTDLFIYIKESLKRCVQLSKGQTLYQLFNVWRKHLHTYAEALHSRLPKGSSILSSSSSSGGSSGNAGQDALKKLQNMGKGITAVVGVDQDDEGVRLSSTEVATICTIVNTSEYCVQTMAKLGDEVRSKIEESYQQQCDLQPEQDEYSGLITKAIKLLVQGLEGRLDAQLQNMLRVPWSQWETVGDQSEYASGISHAVAEYIPQVVNGLSTSYMSFFLDRFISAFCPKFVATLFKAKRISSGGAQQLLLDAQSIKTMLLDVHTLAPEKFASVSLNRYLKVVQKEMAKADNILKVVLAPYETLLDTYLSLVPDGTPNDLAKIMELKGLKKSEQQYLLEQFVVMNHGQAGAGSGGVSAGLALDSISSRQVDAGARNGERGGAGISLGAAASQRLEKGKEKLQKLFKF